MDQKRNFQLCDTRSLVDFRICSRAICGLGRPQGLGSRVSGLGFRVQSLWFRVSDLRPTGRFANRNSANRPFSSCRGTRPDTRRACRCICWSTQTRRTSPGSWRNSRTRRFSKSKRELHSGSRARPWTTAGESLKRDEKP